jgi:hypothetical protein
MLEETQSILINNFKMLLNPTSLYSQPLVPQPLKTFIKPEDSCWYEKNPSSNPVPNQLRHRPTYVTPLNPICLNFPLNISLPSVTRSSKCPLYFRFHHTAQNALLFPSISTTISAHFFGTKYSSTVKVSATT